MLDRIEESISGISGVDRMQGTAQDGFANITVFFVFAKDVQQASQDIRDKISSIRDQLPVEMKEPVLSRFDPSDMPIVQLSLNSTTLDAPSLTRIADPGLTKELRAIPGVAEASVVGGIERELTVEIKPDAMQAAGVSVAQLVVGAAGAEPGGAGGQGERLARRARDPAEGQARDAGGFSRADRRAEERPHDPARRGRDGARRHGGADVVRALQWTRRGRRDGEEVQGVQHVAGVAQVLDKVNAISATLPKGTRLDVVQNSGDHVDRSVQNVEEALIEGALLTVLVVFVFLNSWRSTVITGLALPVSVLASFIAVWAFGFTLNTMSLLGLSLAIGILIDDAIVVRENIVRHIEMGKDHMTASHEGTDEIGLAVAATTFSIVAVFVPVAFMYGVAGQWFKPFALTIACAVLVSLFVSFSLDPMLSAYWADPQVEAHERRNPIARALDRFNDWFNVQADRYTRVIGWALDHRWWMVTLAIAAFASAIVLQVKFGGFGFVPNSDRSELTMQVETPAGSNLAYTKMKTEEAARLARAATRA